MLMMKSLFKAYRTCPAHCELSLQSHTSSHTLFCYLFKDNAEKNLHLHNFDSNYFPYAWDQ